MKKNYAIVSFFSLILLITSCQKDRLYFQENTQNIGNKKEDRSFIVIAKEGEDLGVLENKLTAIGARKFAIKESLKELGLITVITPDPHFPAKARLIPGVESVVVNITMKFRLPENVKVSKITSQKSSPTSKTTADPLSALQWGLESVKARQAWDKGYSGENALVAVLDGGFFLNNPEIAANIIGSHSFVDGQSVQFQGNGFSHGTHVAGTIAAANNGFGVVGVAPKAKLLLVKVLDDVTGMASWQAIIDGIFYAANHSANVINMSLGGYIPTRSFLDDNGTPNDPSDDYYVEYNRDLRDLVKALNRATLYAKLKGSLLIAAAGNDAVDLSNLPNLNIYPAQATGVLAIASNGPLGWGYNQDTSLYRPSVFTNYGKSVIAFGAPGGNYDPSNFDTTPVIVRGFLISQVVSNWVLNIGYYKDGYFSYFWAAGTSMAAPHASGVAALIYGKQRGKISPWLVELIMGASADDYGTPGRDPYFGYGQVNAGRAVSY